MTSATHRAIIPWILIFALPRCAPGLDTNPLSTPKPKEMENFVPHDRWVSAPAANRPLFNLLADFAKAGHQKTIEPDEWGGLQPTFSEVSRLLDLGDVAAYGLTFYYDSCDPGTDAELTGLRTRAWTTEKCPGRARSCEAPGSETWADAIDSLGRAGWLLRAEKIIVICRDRCLGRSGCRPPPRDQATNFCAHAFEYLHSSPWLKDNASQRVGSVAIACEGANSNLRVEDQKKEVKIIFQFPDLDNK